MKPNRGTPTANPFTRKVLYRTHLLSIREERGLTPLEVASRSGLGCVSTLEDAEKGFGIRLDTALKLAKFYEVPVEELWTLVSDKKGSKR